MEGSAVSGLLDETNAWALLELLSRLARARTPLLRDASFGMAEGGVVREVEPGRGFVRVRPGAQRPFETLGRVEPAAAQMLELYLPLCVGQRSETLVVGHVGQSLDGQIATLSGASRYVTGPENIRHMHRLRALFDAVIVGANTVEADNPQLTTRLVPGQNPTRVVLDPALRLSGKERLFDDPSAPTLVLCKAAHAGRRTFARAEVVPVEADNGVLAPAAIARTLAARGLRRLFVEGGGITVSRFLSARAFDRLHVTICPVFIGSGRPGILLPGIDTLEGALRPRARRFDMGEDVLFDCELERSES